MRRFQPALLGGVFTGVVSALPIIGSANLCCCLWVVSGGFLTVYLQRQSPTSAKDTAEAVLGGLIAGVVGALISVGLTGLLAAGGGQLVAELESGLDQVGQIPPEMRDSIVSLASSGAWVLVVLAVTLPIYAVFGMLGSLLAVAVLPKPKPPVDPGTGLNTGSGMIQP